MDGWVKTVQGEIERSLDQLLVPHLRVECKRFYVNLNVKHQRRIFQALQHQQVRLDLRHQRIPDHQHHESSRRFEILLIQIHHELTDK